MNGIVDIGIYGVILICVFFGLYQGGLVSLLHTAGFFLSWLMSYIYYPRLSTYIQSNPDWMEMCLHYVDGAKRVPTIELARTPIASLSDMQVTEAIQGAELPIPFDTIIQENIAGRVLEPMGLSTLGEYFNYSIVGAALNIASFVVILFLVYIVLCVIINLCDYVIRLPRFRYLDWAVGGLSGLLRGLFMVHAIVSFLPVGLAILPANIGFIKDILDASSQLPKYYESNWVLKIVKGWIAPS